MTPARPAAPPAAPTRRTEREVLARATLSPGDAMNKTERRYADHLELRRLAGNIARWDFEAVKLRLADRTFYTPDFRVILPDGTEEYHEVKGFMRDDAIIKIKLAAELHPYPFIVVRWNRGGWQTERFEGKRR